MVGALPVIGPAPAWTLNDLTGAAEIVGEAVMEHLRNLDDVAYVRFASVYRDFQDIDAFRAEIDSLNTPNGGEPA